MQSWGYMVGISGHDSLSISYSIPYDFGDFRPSFILPLFDFKYSGFCGCYGSYKGSGTHFDLRTLSSSIPLYAFDFRFLPLLRTIWTVSTVLYPPSYLIPSPVISVVAIAVTEVLAYTSILYLRFTVPFSGLRFPLPIYSSLLSDS
jgi:hypothetical protein